MQISELTIKRFWDKVGKDGPIMPNMTTPCWTWKASLRNKGYGAFGYVDKNGVSTQGRAHRFSYELHIGPIPKGMFVLHKCDNPPCSNPEHLYLGTNYDNVLDMIRKGRHVPGCTYTKGNMVKGEAHHNSKLTTEKVRMIRQEPIGLFTNVELGKKYGVSQATISRVINGKVWKEV